MPCSREPTRCWPQGKAGAVLACTPTCTRTPGFAPTLAMRCVSADELDRQNQQPSTGAPEGWPCAVPFAVPAWLTVISLPISSAPCSSLQARSASSSFWYWMNPNARSFPDPAQQNFVTCLWLNTHDVQREACCLDTTTTMSQHVSV